jgi:small subunit ribosomal protein S2
METTTGTNTNKEKDKFGLNIEEMNAAGLYFGHRTSKCHPNMKPYIMGVRGSDHINVIDMEKTKELFIQTLEFLQEFIQQGKTILFVGTKLPVRKITRETAEECDMPYVINRWLGGTVTNFSIIKERIDYFNDLKQKKEQGELEKYTKKEQVDIDRELEKLEEKIGGIKDMEKLPDAIFVLNMRADALAIKEAKTKGIKVIGIADTEVDPKQADYFIPANDDAISSVKYILGKVKEVIKKSKSKA